MNANYKALTIDIITKQMAILGPDIAFLKTRSIASLVVGDWARFGYGQAYC